MSERIVVVDDHELVQIGLYTLLTEHGLDVVGQASTGAEGLDLIHSLKPDLALIDIRLPDMSGIQVCQEIRKTDEATRLAVLTALTDKNVVHACIQTGVQGYLLKDLPAEELLRAIRNILAGKAVLDPTVTGHALEWLEMRQEGGSEKEVLDLRDVEILRLMAQGWSNQAIGKYLHLSENTIKALVNDIYRRLGVKNRVEAVMEAYRHGLL
ncbi:MAG: response regulator transcription factor [Hydrogenibacillus sp.]|nr:response regulator transcription factor [Hydrogenibacillus sp.]